jgi:hypothetical protein
MDKTKKLAYYSIYGLVGAIILAIYGYFIKDFSWMVLSLAAATFFLLWLITIILSIKIAEIRQLLENLVEILDRKKSHK